jgi:hypothetical protein
MPTHLGLAYDLQPGLAKLLLSRASPWLDSSVSSPTAALSGILQSRLLLTPKPLLNRIIVGALARASHRYVAGVVAFSFRSNHYHLLVRVQGAEQLALFLGCPWTMG